MISERSERGPIGGRRVRALALLVVTAGLAACGVQLDDGPRQVAAESVPFDLLTPSTATSTTEPQPPSPFQATTVYLVDGDGFLVEVERRLPGEPTVERALLSLLSEPTEAEAESGLGTDIASSTVLRGPVRGPEQGLVTIDLSAEINEVSPESVRRALAQIVFTATAVAGVEEVLFQVDGQARQVPDASGQSTAEPLTRADYRDFVRPPATTTTAATDVPPGG